ncbi:glycosyltransferase [bacterium]|nr:glycosyltransferase [bacterium]
MKRVAFIKFAGLASGGVEKYLQTIACLLPKDKYKVDYYYTNAAPFWYSSFVHPDNDSARKELVESHGVKTISIHVDHKIGDVEPYEWVGTNFWEIFKESDYDLIQTGRGGYPEYPFNLINSCPIIDSIHSFVGEDKPNILKAILLSKWQADKWAASGGNISKAIIIPSVVYVPEVLPEKNLRAELNIPEDAFVYGFHQGNRAGMFHSMSLDAFSKIQNNNNYFVIMGGDPRYRSYVQERGIKNVLFINSSSNVENIHKFLNTLNVFAHSRADGEVCSACIVEALSHSLPVLSHPALNMGHVEQIGDCGIVTDSLERYAAEMLALEQSKDYYAEKSSIAKLQYNTKYDYKKIEQQIRDVYNTVLE